MNQVLSSAFLILLIFCSCNGKLDANYSHTSENRKVKINITGKRSSAVEAWKVTLKVKAYDFEEGQLEFQVYAEDLNEDNISVIWEDEYHAKITIVERDKHKRIFELIASEKQLQLAEM